MPEFKKHLFRDSVVSLILVGLFVAFFYLFRLNIDHTIENIAGLKNQKSFFSQSAQDLSVLIGEWEIAKVYKDEVAALVPTKDSLVALSKDFQAIAKTYDVSLDFSFGTETNAQSQGLGSITFSAVASGAIQDVLDFFEGIENKYYAMRIEAVDITASNRGESSRVAFNGKMFFVAR